MVELTNKEFFQDLDQTIATELFEQTTYPWAVSYTHLTLPTIA